MATPASGKTVDDKQAAQNLLEAFGEEVSLDIAIRKSHQLITSNSLINPTPIAPNSQRKCTGLPSKSGASNRRRSKKPKLCSLSKLCSKTAIQRSSSSRTLHTAMAIGRV